MDPLHDSQRNEHLWLLKRNGHHIACDLAQGERGWDLRLSVNGHFDSANRVVLHEVGVGVADALRRDFEEKGWHLCSLETGQPADLPRLHGLKRFDQNREAIYFAVHPFLHVIEPYARNHGDLKEQWPTRWFDALFLQALYKFHRTVWDWLRAAEHIGRISELVSAGHETVNVQSQRGIEEAYRDSPLFLDLFFYYWRIEADCLANVIPHFYGQIGRRENIPRDSFRRQVRWFAETRSSFDPEYSAILETSLSWFDFLAGRDRGSRGVRDVLTHHRGTYQISATFWRDGRRAVLSAALHGDSGVLREDVMPTIRTEIRSYCLFLDRIVTHFSGRIDDQIGKRVTAGVLETPALGYHQPGVVKSVWAFPIID
jgi:hypothetical protein